MVVGETCHLCTPQNRPKTEKDREEPGRRARRAAEPGRAVAARRGGGSHGDLLESGGSVCWWVGHGQ